MTLKLVVVKVQRYKNRQINYLLNFKPVQKVTKIVNYPLN